MSNETFWGAVKFAACIVALAAVMGRGAANADAIALHAADAHGFTEPRITGRSDFFAWANGCGGHDATAWDVTAKRDGRTVRLYVCSGAWTKGATVRVAP